MNLDDVRFTIRNSVFNKNHYSVDINLKDFIKNILCFTNYELSDNITENDYNKLFDAVPKFQRDNDKWTKKMKISYVENLIKGCKPQPLMLYTIGDDLQDAMILDGLQRTTAIYDFVVGNIKIFGGYSYKDLVDNKIIRIGVTIPIRIYTFNNEAEVVNFYIEMNENITHSSKDIDKARKYLESIENKG